MKITENLVIKSNELREIEKERKQKATKPNRQLNQVMMTFELVRGEA